MTSRLENWDSRPDDLSQALSELDALTGLERGIKATLADWFARWRGARP